MRKSGVIAAVAIAVTACAVAAQNGPTSAIGGTEADPTDITALLIANRDVALAGGVFVVRVPRTGTGIVTAASVDARTTSYRTNGFSTADNPTIAYAGTISGNGAVIVRSAFDATRPTGNTPFSGGALIFTNPAGQSWGIDGIPSRGHGAAALRIESNAMVEFFQAGCLDCGSVKPVASAFPWSDAKSRNVANDGYLYSSAQNAWGSITGTGVTVMQFFGGDNGQFVDGAYYSGRLFNLCNGLRVYSGAQFEDQPGGAATLVNSVDISVWATRNNQFLTDPATYKPGDPIWTVPSDIKMQAIDVQVWNTGIVDFTGIMLPPFADASTLDQAPRAEAMKGMYITAGQGFGRVFFISARPTIMMGDGRDIVTSADGVTTNVFLQGNPWNTFLRINGFENAPKAREQFGAIALDYNGTYRVNFNMNAATTGFSVITGPDKLQDWQNLIVMDPTLANPRAMQPNNPVVTTTVFFAGLTRIDRNAVLTLGDGTTGNNAARTIVANGRTIASTWSDSSGNGMLMTQGNQALLGTALADSNKTVNFEIAVTGKLVVDNTPGARDMTADGASAAVAAWVSANQLDGITGSGSVEQLGTLALTLGSAAGKPDSYSGGTTIGSGATLIVGSTSALGQRDPGNGATSGRVINRGVLQAATGVRTIAVPGDYLQSAQTTTAAAVRHPPDSARRRERWLAAMIGDAA